MPRVFAKSPIWIIVIFAVVFGAIINPPGTMVSFDGGSVSYVICTGDGIKTITVHSSKNENRQSPETESLCDFFASQIAAIPFSAPTLEQGIQHNLSNIIAQKSFALISIGGVTPYAPRAPPAQI